MKVAVIGAGPAGLTTAYKLAQAGIGVDLYEASGQVGGMCRTLDLWDQKVDIGPHRFFSSDARVNRLWLEVIEKDYQMVDRLTRIYYNKKLFYYPLKAFNALANLGIFKAISCLWSYMVEKIKPTKQDGSFENWVVSRFGRQLYSIFFKTYTEKLWGISCQELDADFAAQRIKKLSLFEAIKNALFGSRGNKHKTLVDQFAYPNEGTGMVYERMAELIEKMGGKVHLNQPVERVLTTNNKAHSLVLENGKELAYDQIISSMPLTLLVERLPEVPENIVAHCKELKFRNTVLVYLKVDAEELFPDNWLYVHDSELRMGRITNFRNWVPDINQGEKSTILALEYWCNFEDDFWQWDESRLIELAKKEIKKTGLIGSATVSEGMVYRIPRCYPIYNKGYKAKLTNIENYLDTIENLKVIGRYGAFKYNNQDHSILMGLLVADNLINKTNHSLWDINTDYETYQEAALITKDGLQVQ